jgi:hypothetical protein
MSNSGEKALLREKTFSNLVRLSMKANLTQKITPNMFYTE